MSRETTDTRFKITPKGTHKMTCVAPCLKKMTRSDSPKPYYEFKFEYSHGGKMDTHLEIRFPSQAAMLLRAFKCNEPEPGVFDWDKEEVNGKVIMAEIDHIADKKDPSKVRASIIKADPVVEEVPF